MLSEQKAVTELAVVLWPLLSLRASGDVNNFRTNWQITFQDPKPPPAPLVSLRGELVAGEAEHVSQDRVRVMWDVYVCPADSSLEGALRGLRVVRYTPGNQHEIRAIAYDVFLDAGWTHEEIAELFEQPLASLGILFDRVGVSVGSA